MQVEPAPADPMMAPQSPQKKLENDFVAQLTFIILGVDAQLSTLGPNIAIDQILNLVSQDAAVDAEMLEAVIHEPWQGLPWW